MKTKGKSKKAKVKSKKLMSVMLFTFYFCLFTFDFSSSVFAVGKWSEQKSGTLAWLRAVWFVNERKGWVVGGNGTLLATEDGGANWKKLKSPTEDNFVDIVFLSETEGWILCESDRYQGQGPRSYLLHTTNGGTDWQKVYLDSTDADLRISRIIFGAEDKGLIFGEAGMVYVTTDNGAKWVGVAAPSRFLLLGGAILNAAQRILVGAGSTILYTEDGGKTWRQAILRDRQNPNNPATSTAAKTGSSKIRFTSVSFTDTQNGLAVGYSGKVFTTNDGGRSWSSQNSQTDADLFDVKFLYSNNAFAIGDKGTLLDTNNGGFTWEGLNLGTTHRLERVFFVTPEHGWIVGFGGKIFSYSNVNKKPQISP